MFLPVHQLQETSYKPSTFFSASWNARWINSQFLKSIPVDLDVFRLAWCFSSGYFVNSKHSSFLYRDKLWVFLPCYHYPDSWSFFSYLPVTLKDHFSCLLVIYILLLGGKAIPINPVTFWEQKYLHHVDTRLVSDHRMSEKENHGLKEF